MTFKNLFKLPSPVELGRSKSSALPSRIFDPFTEGYSWEDWDAEVKKLYPVRFFIVEKLFPAIYFFFYGIYRRCVVDPIYWIKCHVLPSYRWHFVDIRNVSPLHKYNYGYMDPSERMLFAAFACLRDYIEKCDPYEVTKEDIESESQNEDSRELLVEQQRILNEAREIYKWWTYWQVREDNESDHAYNRMRHAFSKEEREELGREWLNLLRRNEEKVQEMLIRLVKIRQSLWT